MSGKSKHVTPQHPCPICGYTDWCNFVTFPETGNVLAYCQRVTGQKGDTAPYSGKMWRHTGIIKKGGFNVWEPLEQYEASRAAFLKEKYPDYKGKGYKQPVMVKKAAAEKKIEVKGVVPVADTTRLNEVYSALLDLLVLEDKHGRKLRDEWDHVDGLFDKLVKTYRIKSLPPEDRLRFSSKERLKNLSRKKIMEKLIDKVGVPEGVPGFYMRADGSWTMYYLCGIVYPVFNTDGEIVRIRIGTDYPLVKGSFDGKEGTFSYFLKDEKAGWWFRQLSNQMLHTLVWQYGAEDNKISLNKKGYPDGKVEGKYKNFTSKYLIDEEDSAGNIVSQVNKFNRGCESGSFCSVYTKEGDDPTFVYITEGEKKAMVANLILNVPVISVPGVNALSKVFENEPNREMSMIDSLMSKGTRAVVLVYDADKTVNQKVLREEQRAVNEFKERNIRIAIGEWNPQWGKGLDDVLLTGVKPQIYLV